MLLTLRWMPIGTWPYTHKSMTIAALAAGKHVLTEARMAMDLAEAKEMLAASRASPQLVAQVVPSPMTLAYDGTIKRLLRDSFATAPSANCCISMFVVYRARQWTRPSRFTGATALSCRGKTS